MTIKEATEKYKWLHYDPVTHTLDMFLDHHMLSTLRTCEAKFQLEHLLNLRGSFFGLRNPWFLDFGILLHSCFEKFYKQLKETPDNPYPIDQFLSYGKELWVKMDMEYYKDKDDKYDDVGGMPGFLSLLTQYYAFYMDLRVRVIDVEVIFGYEKEVWLGDFFLKDYFDYEADLRVSCFLTGRIDLVIDNGFKIGPVDHKHTHRFKGNEWQHFNPQDAITGYILALNATMLRHYPKYFADGRQCLSAWVYHISGASPSKSRKTGEIGNRFKTTPIDKVPSQLEEFKLRQVSSFKRVADLIFNSKVAEWTTTACDNIFMRQCPYKTIHEAPSSEWNAIINNNFIVGEAWSPQQEEVKTGE